MKRVFQQQEQNSQPVNFQQLSHKLVISTISWLAQIGKSWWGTVWPGKTYFPDFNWNGTLEWWYDNVAELWSIYKFDGLWIDMNEPASFEDMFCPENEINYPQWTPGISTRTFGSKTICPSFWHQNNIRQGSPDARFPTNNLIKESTNNRAQWRHRDIHNLYGLTQAKASYQTMKMIEGDKRPYILSSYGSAFWS